MIGQTISHYKITAKLGEGGMGVVYKAEDTRLDRIVALKLLAQDLMRDEENRKRFLREAKAAAGINHPNVCTVHEISDFEGRDFLALEYIDGETLDAKIAGGPLKVEEALTIARQVADGLAAAHEKKRRSSRHQTRQSNDHRRWASEKFSTSASPCSPKNQSSPNSIRPSARRPI